MSFTNLGLNESLLKAIKDQGYTSPTPIQKQAIPVVIEGKDVLAAAQTGTGKTAGFTLPLLERLSETHPKMGKKQIRVLVLTPTRELAAQVAESIKTYGKYMKYTSTVVYGGVGINPQLATIRRGVDIVIATPGRLLDIAGQQGIDFSALETLVLDEADRMLDMGFIHDIKKLMKMMPKERQTLLFSATFSLEIKKLASGLLKNPVLVEVARENTTADQISQVVHFVDKSRKRELLSQLIKTKDWRQVLVFTRTKHGANRLTKQLEEAGISAAAIHGNKSQGARTKALASFKANEIRVLVATDIAARGIDIDQLPHVVNYELPNVPEDYVHRIGRTGRAGQSGEAVSLVCVDEHKLLFDIEKFIKSEIKKVHIEAFTPDPNIKAEPIQNGRGGGQKRGGGNSRNRSRNTNTSNREHKESSAKKANTKNSAAAKIGNNIQEKLDKLEKRDMNPNRQRRR
ncbi:DEAD/DEAH box helicase [Sulfurovum sp. NBC37-1]|uniref:DEAD/DEAH box helicase n=1 Tax=Sulfurovum sp. (strain NBC37-1) TaxID=387093 RepID=UPI0001587C31|nr:DEAD/DEAH box helicase [Sulfurovum sp. NBC37-1]BAF72250.1 ATP-dependent RNA helicase [Sulfurovum sp. NBC37-1]